MKTLLIALILVPKSFLFSQGTLVIQDKPFIYNRDIDSGIWKALEHNLEFKKLSYREKCFFYWANVFRSNPKDFFNSIILDFLNQFPEANSTYAKSLERDIKKNANTLPLLFPDDGLNKMASKHSRDLLSRGSIISHSSSSGKKFQQRMDEVGSYMCGAENIYIGSLDPLEALISLLIDFGVPDLGHRKNLLEIKFIKMGVSFPQAGNSKGLLVQELACE